VWDDNGRPITNVRVRGGKGGGVRELGLSAGGNPTKGKGEKPDSRAKSRASQKKPHETRWHRSQQGFPGKPPQIASRKN